MIITINNEQYEAQSGQTILDVARENGIEIPTLCYSPHLSITGACRICVVEDKKTDKLVASCHTPVQDGMVIETDSPRVIEARKTILDLLISDHPLDCMTCEANGNCELQDLAYKYGIKETSFEVDRNERFAVKSKNEFIEVDPNKCILCTKCVRVDHEIQCADAIDLTERGFQTRVGTAFDEDLGADNSDCVFCGQCVEMCPTGALSYKPGKGKGREYDFEKVVTTCGYCGVGCQLELKVKDNEIVEVGSVYQAGTPNPHGESCVKGRFAYGFINSPDRLKTPLIKRNGEFEEASWEEALGYVAENFSRIRDEYGGKQTAMLSSARCTNEENYLAQKFMRVVMGTNNVEHCARL